MDNGLMDKEAFSSLGFKEKDPEWTLPKIIYPMLRKLFKEQYIKRNIYKQPKLHKSPELPLPLVKNVFSTQEFIKAFKAQSPMTRFYISLGFLTFSIGGIQMTKYIEEKIPIPKHEQVEIIDLDEETRKRLEKELSWVWIEHKYSRS
jgi:hypothetical protein